MPPKTGICLRDFTLCFRPLLRKLSFATGAITASLKYALAALPENERGYVGEDPRAAGRGLRLRAAAHRAQTQAREKAIITPVASFPCWVR